MRNATQQDVENVKNGIFPKNVMFMMEPGRNNYLCHLKFDWVDRVISSPSPYQVGEILLLVESANGKEVRWVHPNNLYPISNKGPATTPAKLKRKPKKGTKPVKRSDIEIGDTIITRGKYHSGVVQRVSHDGNSIELDSGCFVSIRPIGATKTYFDVTKIIKAKKVASINGSQEKLPQQFKVGDKVVMTEEGMGFYSKGDIGVVHSCGTDTAWIDFRGQGNTNVIQKGVWCAACHMFKLYEEPKDTSEYIVWVTYSNKNDGALLSQDENHRNDENFNFKGTLAEAEQYKAEYSKLYPDTTYTIYKLVKVESSK